MGPVETTAARCVRDTARGLEVSEGGGGRGGDEVFGRKERKGK